jgi:hypothetical protein
VLDTSFCPVLSSCVCPTDPAHEREMGERRRAVKAAMEHAWSNYVEYAWGQGTVLLLSWCTR